MDGHLLLFGLMFLYGYVLTPVLAVYCWLRWARSKRRRSRRTRFSFASLVVSTPALLVGIAVLAASSMRHDAFLYLSPEAHRTYFFGIVASSLACILGSVGIFYSNPLRFKAFFVAMGAAVFWFLAGSTGA